VKINPVRLVLCVAALGFSSQAFAGKTLFCQAQSYAGKKGAVLNGGSVRGDVAALLTQFGADCKDRKGKNYYLFGAGFGAIFKISNSYFTVTCPLVRKSRFKEGTSFGVVRASAAALVGANVGVAVNESLGFCIMAGVEAIGFGGGVSLGFLEIGEGRLEDTSTGSMF
jgi:hypothetical protein